MIAYTTAKTDEDIQSIIELQKHNLPQNLTEEQMHSQGFVTVVHSFEALHKMNSIEQSIVATNNDEIIGYLLAMTPASKSDIPVLVPMFDAFDNVVYDQKKISGYTYIVVGQVCIAEGWRGKGILDDCYTAYKNHFKSKYEFAITEINSTNKRSIKAHERIGFKLVHSYSDPEGVEWNVVLWDWRNKSG